MPPAAFVEACRRLVGEGGLLVEEDAIAPYTVDFWGQYRGRTELVLLPRDTAQVAGILAAASAHRVPIVPQGGNTGLVAGGIPDASGAQVVLSLARMERIREIDPAGEYLVAEAGCVLARIQEEAERVGRMFPLSLGAEGSCRIGGNLATNAGGVNVLRYGMARQLVLGLEVVLADGRVWNGLRPLLKDNTGYDLKQLFIGAEGTLGVITAACLRLVPAPRERVTVWLAIPRPEDALTLLRRFRDRFGELISSFELLTGFGVRAAVEHLPGVRAPLAGDHPWHLLVELAWSLPRGLAEPAEALLGELFEEGLVTDGTIAASEAQRAMLWRIREGQSEATRHMGEIVRSDVAVTPARLPELIRRMERFVHERLPEATLVPFGHVGDGNLHFNFVVPPDRVAAWRPVLLDRLVEEVVRLGGSFSAEHGIGRLKVAELLRYKPPLELELMRRLKTLFDPLGILNPGAVLPAAGEDGACAGGS